MKHVFLVSTILLVLPLTALAADPPPPPPTGWSGSAEFGLALATGNTKSQNLNLALDLKFNDDRWKDDFYFAAVRNENDVTTSVTDSSTNPPTTYNVTNSQTTANRYDAGASMGYKLDERSYIVGAGRYDHDEFSSYDYQYILSLGYGLQAIKDASNQLAFEIGPGYKVEQPTSFYVLNTDTPPVLVKVKPDSDSSVAARGKIDYKHNFNASTSFVESFLVESTSDNTFIQNDAALIVAMTKKLALKIDYQVRNNSDVLPGFKKTDQLFTTNLVYGF
jgi:putative salt-induced outer membrane protein